MFPIEDKQNKKLNFMCKHCNKRVQVKSSQKRYCVYQNYVNEDEETNIDAIVNPDIIMDPTLPRSRDIQCPKCGNNEAVFFNAQSRNPNEAMALIMVCTNDTCKHYWKRSGTGKDI